MSQSHGESLSSGGSTRQNKGGGNPVQRVALYYRQVIAELRKVIWPTRNEFVTYTIVSVVFCAVLIAIVAGLDYGFTKAVLHVFG